MIRASVTSQIVIHKRSLDLGQVSVQPSLRASVPNPLQRDSAPFLFLRVNFVFWLYHGGKLLDFDFLTETYSDIQY